MCSFGLTSSFAEGFQVSSLLVLRWRLQSERTWSSERSTGRTTWAAILLVSVKKSHFEDGEREWKEEYREKRQKKGDVVCKEIMRLQWIIGHLRQADLSIQCRSLQISCTPAHIHIVQFDLGLPRKHIGKSKPTSVTFSRLICHPLDSTLVYFFPLHDVLESSKTCCNRLCLTPTTYVSETGHLCLVW